ncbi:MAG: hypothetical protein U0930_17980 [Pirellulales bacterium]
MNCSSVGIFALIVFAVASVSAQQLDDPFAPLGSSKSDRMKSVEIEPLTLDPVLPSDTVKKSNATASPTSSSIGSPEMKAWLKKNHSAKSAYRRMRTIESGTSRKEVFSGVHVKLDSGKLETHRNRKLVNAGTWTRYEITFVEPEKNLQVDFKRLDVINNDTIAFGNDYRYSTGYRRSIGGDGLAM